jgi:nitroreductase
MRGSPWGVAAGGSLGQALQGCLEAAVAAPSIHNSQPWRFRIAGEVVDVLADRSRQLAAVDPHGRELLISVGAAVFNLRVAVFAAGRVPTTRMLPAATEPDLAARVTPGPPVEVSGTVRALADAIPLRRTTRRPFADRPLPADVAAGLATAALAEGATLVVADRQVRDAVLDLVRVAEMARRRDPGYWTELQQWTAGDPARDDGVPVHAFGPWSAMEAIPLRDFGLLRPVPDRTVEQYEVDPTIAVLYTAGDGPSFWLRAGQALERVLLTATSHGVASTLMTQPLELPHLRALLTDSDGVRHPQAIIRFGYAAPTPPTPRRSLIDVVDGLAPRAPS